MFRKRLPPSKPHSIAAESLYSTAVTGVGDGDNGSCEKYTEDICIAAKGKPFN